MRVPLCLRRLRLAVSSVLVVLSASCVLIWTPPAFSDDAQRKATIPGQDSSATVTIPGPLRSFLRMGGISQKVSSDEVLPLLARNVFTLGYQGTRPTEFLILLNRYVHQARELTTLAGPDGTIRVSGCDNVQPLLKVLGYRLRQGCGDRNASLMTADPERAFLTTDSGFPLPELEESLQSGKPFSYPYPSSQVPSLFTEAEWVAAGKTDPRRSKDLLDALIHDPALARLYRALSKNDAETRAVFIQSVGFQKLLPYAAVLDFYGSHIAIRSGRVLTPGGPSAAPVWKDLVGASPDSPPEFVVHLISKDKGWLAAYFDSMFRISQEQQVQFTQSHRLKRYYEAFHSSDPAADAARPMFRPAPGLLLLLARLQWDSSGEPLVPGNLETWKTIFRQKWDSKPIREWQKRSGHWNRSEQLIEAMFGCARVQTDSGPLQIYLALSELDSKRSSGKRLSPATVRLLADKYSEFSGQYLIFSEFPSLNDASITLFLSTAQSIDKIPSRTLRGNAMGIFQANVGLWQILARQDQIPHSELNSSWQELVKPFAKIGSSPQLFDSGRAALSALVRAASGKAGFSQGELISLLAGPHQGTADGQRMHQEVANKIRAVMDGQRLVSLDTLLAIGNGLNEIQHGTATPDHLVSLAGELREFEMPQPIFTGNERTEWAAGTYNNRHTELQMRTDLMKILKSQGSKAQVEEARGQLTSFFRDTLVGLNYAYYEPPGAQALHNNPLFVRSHDFSGETVTGIEQVWQAPQLFGQGSPAGGGAHLIGSLADLPYVLAELEQDFISPENVQALIWRELVPGLLMNATLPRWWNVTPNELHAVALYQRSGEELLRTSKDNDELRGRVLSILSDRMPPQRLDSIEEAVKAGRLDQAAPLIMPADTFYLTAEFRRRYPQEHDAWGPTGQELASLSERFPRELAWERLSQDFGVPHPALTQSYARELLNVKPFPAFEGYSSRLLAESWDSSNLYWARLADEMGYSPIMLNRMVPELTHRMVEKIFATDSEDWPAVLRALRETGDEFRTGKLAAMQSSVTASQP
jgi:hypothetical protein